MNKFLLFLIILFSYFTICSQTQPTSSFSLNADKIVGNAISDGSSYTEDIIISNVGNAVLSNISALVSGADSGQFAVSGVPTSINTQSSSSFQVSFTPTSNGPKSAFLTITGTNANPVTIPLRGLGTAGYGGENEPSLQWVLDAQLGAGAVNVGETDPTTTPLDLANGSTYNDILGDEISVQRFIRSQDGPVTIELLAVYGPANGNIACAFGWYESGNGSSMNELFTVSNVPGTNAQRLNAAITGVTDFDPGINEFGFYISWPFLDDRNVFSEDVLNIFDPVVPHKVRAYPLPEEADAYILVYELVTYAHDYNDVVVIIRNVQSPFNQQPLSDAGGDVTLVLPNSSRLLSGTGSDPDGGLVSYLWTQLSGPNTALLTGDDTTDLTVDGLIEGTYVFDFAVTDDESNTVSDQVSISVAAAAPSDIWLEAECAVFGSEWSLVSDVNFSEGEYVSATSGANFYSSAPTSSDSWISFDFIATAGTYNMYALVNTPNDNNDSFWVRANGGAWVKWNNLLGTGFDWRQLYDSDAGAALVSFDLVEGANTLDVAIRENGASIDKIYLSDSTTAPTGLGQPATNCGPVDADPLVNAGEDVTIILPVQSTVLNGTGSDPDGGLVSYLWTQVSGPNTALLTGDDTTDLTVDGLIEGTYVFDFAVTDDESNTVSDQVSISVVAAASSDIWLEAECAVFGSGWSLVSDVNVSEGEYVSATSRANFYSSAPTSSDSWISFDFTAAAGSYNMYALVNTPNDNNDSFWVRANGGAWVKWNGLLRAEFNWRQLYDSDAGAALVSFDLVEGANTLDVAIRENGASIDKIHLSDSTTAPTGLGQSATNCEILDTLPLADAGSSVSLTLPNSSRLLSGTGSDPDGGLVSYLWTQLSGPNTALLTGDDTTDLTVDGLIEGTYVFDFAVTDDESNTVSDQVSISVVAAASSDIWLEAECAVFGSGWSLVSDSNASEGEYVSATSGSNFYSSSPTSSDSWISFDFTAAAGTYNMYALVNTPNDNNDSFWVRANGGAWVKWNGLLRAEFNWRQLYDSDAGAALVSFDLVEGANTLDIAIRENGASIDKIHLSDSAMAPTGLGQPATNCETAQNSGKTIGRFGEEGERIVKRTEDSIENYSLRLNKKTIIYPNPALDIVSIQLNSPSEISEIKIFDALGRMCLSVNGSKILNLKSHTFDISSMPTGLYFITIRDSEGEVYNHKLVLAVK